MKFFKSVFFTEHISSKQRESKRTSAEQGEEEAAGMPPKANEPACRERTGCARPKGDSLLPLKEKSLRVADSFFILNMTLAF